MRCSARHPAASLTLLSIFAAAALAPADLLLAEPPAPHRLLVKIKAEAGARGLDDAMGRSGISGLRARWRSGATRWSVIDLPEDEDPVLSMQRLSRDPAIEAVEPDRIAFVTRVAPDDLRPAQWGLDNTGQNVNGAVGLYDADIDAPEAWDLSRGDRSVIVAILDTGVHTDHPDLGANLLAGYDFVNGDSNPWDDAPLGHGTPVAGIIGAVGDNGTGIAGINWQVSLLPVKVCDAEGRCPYSAIVAGMEYAIGRGARILNMSFSCDEHQGADGSCGASRAGACWSRMMFDALQAARAGGALAVAAAGNCGASLDDATKAYPCSYNLDNVLCVGATDSRDEPAWFSNHGSVRVRVAAPGAGILSLSTYMGASLLWDGTSFSAPMAAGAAALVLSRNNGFTAAALARRVATGDALPSLSGLVKGGMRLNARRSLEDLFRSASSVSASLGGAMNLAGDFTGDGLLDACEGGPQGHRVAGSDGSALAPFQTWSIQPAAAAPELAGDVDGDGRDDIVMASGAGVAVMLSGGSAFSVLRLWSASPWRTITLLADVNGDGRADLVQSLGKKGWRVSLSTGASFAAATLWSGTGGETARALGDFDGDGSADLLRVRNGRIEVSLSRGTSFAPPAVWATGTPGASLQAGDVNGDGRADLVGFSPATGCFEVMLSDGVSLGASRPWACGGARYWSLGRFDPDGRADLVRILPGAGWQVLSSTR